MVISQEENLKLQEDKLSRINAAGIINITLENLWRDCYSSMAKGDLVTWNRKLDSIWLILAGDVTPNSDDEKKFNEFDLEIHKTGSLYHKKTGVGFKEDENKNNISLQYLLLRKKSLFLRRLQNQQGKGTAYLDEDQYDFD